MSPQSLSYFTDPTCTVSAAASRCCSRPYRHSHLQNLCGVIPVADMFVSGGVSKLHTFLRFLLRPARLHECFARQYSRVRFGCVYSRRRAGNACRGRRRVEQNDWCMYALPNLPTCLLQARPFRLRSLNTDFMFILCTELRASCHPITFPQSY